VIVLLPGLTGGSTDTYVQHAVQQARAVGVRAAVSRRLGAAATGAPAGGLGPRQTGSASPDAPLPTPASCPTPAPPPSTPQKGVQQPRHRAEPGADAAVLLRELH
jgi:hypothetical protein